MLTSTSSTVSLAFFLRFLYFHLASWALIKFLPHNLNKRLNTIFRNIPCIYNNYISRKHLVAIKIILLLSCNYQKSKTKFIILAKQLITKHVQSHIFQFHFGLETVDERVALWKPLNFIFAILELISTLS